MRAAVEEYLEDMERGSETEQAESLDALREVLSPTIAGWFKGQQHPDQVGQSAYRTVHEYAADVLEEFKDKDDPDGPGAEWMGEALTCLRESANTMLNNLKAWRVHTGK